jgi:hypothetical protein
MQDLWICSVEVIVGTQRAAPAPRVEDSLIRRLANPVEVGALR